MSVHEGVLQFFGRWVVCFLQFFGEGGSSNFSWGLQFFGRGGGWVGASWEGSGVANFLGGCLQFFGGSPIFWGVPPIFQRGCLQFFLQTRSTRGRYASYWNAFLYSSKLQVKQVNSKSQTTIFTIYQSNILKQNLHFEIVFT